MTSIELIKLFLFLIIVDLTLIGITLTSINDNLRKWEERRVNELMEKARSEYVDAKREAWLK